MRKGHAEYLAEHLGAKIMSDARLDRNGLKLLVSGMRLEPIILTNEDGSDRKRLPIRDDDPPPHWGIRITYKGRRDYGMEQDLLNIAREHAETLCKNYHANDGELPWNSPALSKDETEFSAQSIARRFSQRDESAAGLPNK